MYRLRRSFPTAGAAAGVAGLLALAGCSPALDWRDVRPPGMPLVVEMPCKPDTHERRVPLAGPPVRVVLQACDSDGQTWGLMSVDLDDPARVGPVLSALLAAAAANIGAQAGSGQPFVVKGATPQAGSQRVRLQGHRPQGPAVEMVVAVFTHGTRVYQMTALGDKLQAEAVDTFLASARINP